jgi:hypothetical protein
MPDPIVIIGPASGPAGPIAGPPTPSKQTGDSPPEETPEQTSSQPSGFPRKAGRIAVLAGSGLWAVLVAVARGTWRVAVPAARGLWAALLAVARLVQEYPRYTLAAGASFLILGSIAYTQSGSGKSRRAAVTTAITGGPSKPRTGASQEQQSDGLKTTAAGKSSTAAAEPGSSVTTHASTAKQTPDRDTADPDAAHLAAAETPDAASLGGPPAPKPGGKLEEATPAPAVAQAPPPEKGEASSAKASTTTDPTGDLPFDPVPAPPAARESGIATLLGGATEAGRPPSGPEHAKNASPAKSATTVDALVPAPTPVATTPLPGVVASTDADHPAALSAPGSDRALKTGVPKSAADAHAKEVQPAHDEKAQPQTEPLDLGPASEPTKDTVENPPAVPKAAQSPTPPHELQPEPAAGSPAAKTHAASDEPKSPELSRAAAPELAPPVVSTEAPPLSSGDAAGKTFVAAPADELPVPAHEALKTKADTSTSGREPSALHRDAAAAGQDMPVAPAATGSRSAAGSAIPNSDQPASGAIEPATRAASAAPGATLAEPPKRRELAAGWIEIPNSGNLTLDEKAPVDEREAGGGSSAGAESRAPRDRRAHAAKDMPFEPESNQIGTQPAVASDSAPSGTSLITRSDAGSAPRNASNAGSAPRNASVAGQIESVPHVVEPKENFWTISRLYYSSGRYYQALWKANAAKYPDINVLHVGDVIVIPPVEDLDPAYIAAPRSRAPAGMSASAPGPARDGNAGRSGGGSEPADRPEARLAARPRSMGAVPPGRPAYKVRPYDTLRSIARDTLGDSRRADEIRELNRDLIDDPSQLIVGQLLELPEDARTSVRRAARSR